VYDFQSMTEVASLPAGNALTMIDISPDGRVLLVVSSNLVRDRNIMVIGMDDFTSLPGDSLSQTIRRYEMGTWSPLSGIESEIESVFNEEGTQFAILNVRFSRDGNRLVAFGEFRRELPRGITEIGRTLFELDLHSPGSGWQLIHTDALPLHADGRFLIDGRRGSALDTLVERMAPASSVPSTRVR